MYLYLLYDPFTYFLILVVVVRTNKCLYFTKAFCKNKSLENDDFIKYSGHKHKIKGIISGLFKTLNSDSITNIILRHINTFQSLLYEIKFIKIPALSLVSIRFKRDGYI